MKAIDPRVSKLLRDIDVSSRRIIERMAGESLETFTDPDNLDAQDIVARRLMIIGEAAAAILKKHGEFCLEHPNIPLSQARGMRNALVHDYDGINWKTVWNTIKLAIPDLLDAITPLLRDNEK